MERESRTSLAARSGASCLLLSCFATIKFVFLSNFTSLPLSAITVYVLVLSIKFPLSCNFPLLITTTAVTAKIAMMINMIFFISYPIYRPSSIIMVVAKRPTRRGGITLSPLSSLFVLHPTYIPFMLLLPIISRASTRSLERLR